MNIIAIIPARMGSSRYPGKPLALIHNVPMVGHVTIRTAMCKLLTATYIATCDQVIMDYAASKGAIDVLTRGLSLEVAAQGIRVNGVRPGFIYTDMHADGGEPGRVDRIKGNIPLQRGGQPVEVAAAIAWLLSDEASYATGTFIDVAGGR